MTLYSGFATRKLEQKYYECVSGLLTLFNQQVIQFVQMYSKTQVLQELAEFRFKLNHLISQIKQLETSKYAPPKFGALADELLSRLNGNRVYQQNRDELSEIKSTSIDKKPRTNIRITREKGHSLRVKHKQSENSKKQIKPNISYQGLAMEELLRNRPSLSRKITDKRVTRPFQTIRVIQQFQDEEQQDQHLDPSVRQSIAQTCISSKHGKFFQEEQQSLSHYYGRNSKKF